MHSRLPVLVLLAAAAAIAGCSSEEPPPEAPATALPATPGAPPAAAAGPEPFKPLTSRSAGGQGSAIVAPGAIFMMPADWIAETPSSSMRLAQARIPGPAGDGQLTAFYFGAGGGGGLESNLSRWVGQVEIDAGTEPSRAELDTASGFRVTWIEVQGTIKPSGMGMGPTEPQPGSRMLAAVVEGPQGPWYFKATGPSENLASQREAFLGMLKNVAVHD